jgi:hypothetical protein
MRFSRMLTTLRTLCFHTMLVCVQVKRVVEGAAGVKISLRMRLSAKIVRNGQVSNGSVTLL